MATRYTQQMKDDGVKMVEGHIVFHSSYGEVELAFNVSANGDTAYIDVNGDYQFSHADELNPVQDLVNGAAYEFDYEGVRRSGIYCMTQRSLCFDVLSHVLAKKCANIVRLVPEVNS